MKPIAAGLFTDGPSPALLGGRDKATGRIVFPCPPGQDYEPWPLQRQGTLWSYTIQRFRPKTPPYAGPEAFQPFALGYVELPGETIVETRLTGVAFDAIHIGMPMRLTFVPLDPEAADPVMIHAFEPVPGKGEIA